MDPYGSESAAIQIDLSPVTQSNSSSMGVNLTQTQSEVGTLTFPNAQLSTFDCYAINVVGPGIPSTNPHPDENPGQVLADMYQGSSCAYPGVTSPPIFAGIGTRQSISMSVPTGEKRIIQVVGIIDPTGLTCGNPHPIGGSNEEGAKIILEIARVQEDLFSSKTITMPNDWANTANAIKLNRQVDCNGAQVSALRPGLIPGLAEWHEGHIYNSSGCGANWPFTGFGDAIAPAGTAPNCSGLQNGLNRINLAYSSYLSAAAPAGLSGSYTAMTFVAVSMFPTTGTDFTVGKAGSASFMELKRVAPNYVATVSSGSTDTTSIGVGSEPDLGKPVIHLVHWSAARGISLSTFIDGMPQLMNASTPAGISSLAPSSYQLGGSSTASKTMSVMEALTFTRRLNPEESRNLVRYLAAKYRIRARFAANPFN